MCIDRSFFSFSLYVCVRLFVQGLIQQPEFVPHLPSTRTEEPPSDSDEEDFRVVGQRNPFSDHVTVDHTIILDRRSSPKDVCDPIDPDNEDADTADTYIKSVARYITSELRDANKVDFHAFLTRREKLQERCRNSVVHAMTEATLTQKRE